MKENVFAKYRKKSKKDPEERVRGMTVDQFVLCKNKPEKDQIFLLAVKIYGRGICPGMGVVKNKGIPG